LPFALTLIGLLLIVTGYRGTYQQFGALVAGEFTGKPNFITFAVAILVLGALGYIPAFRIISRLLLLLVMIGIVVSNRGFFANFQKALATGAVQPAAVASGSAPVTAQSSTADINSAIQSHQSGAFGQAPETGGQAKFNGWLNYFLGR
jgi:hypothetical protein